MYALSLDSGRDNKGKANLIRKRQYGFPPCFSDLSTLINLNVHWQ